MVVGIVALLAIEIMQSKQLSAIIQSDKEDFLPMVYENQVYHASMMDGLDIVCPAFHTELLRRKCSDNPVLVFRYSGLSCKGCVQSCLNELRRQCPEYKENNRILIIASEAVENKLPYNSLLLESGDALGYDVEDTHIPHFFVYDHQIIHTFIPDQTDLNALKIYLSSIIGRYGI